MRKFNSSNDLRAVCVNKERSAVTPNTARATNTPSVTNHHIDFTLDYEPIAPKPQSRILGDNLRPATVGPVVPDTSRYGKAEPDICANYGVKELSKLESFQWRGDQIMRRNFEYSKPQVLTTNGSLGLNASTYIPTNSISVANLTVPQAEREVTLTESEDYIVGETYFGYIEDQADALAVIEATIAKILVPFTGSSVDMSQFKVRSGSVAVIPESCRFVKRWRDGLKWSPSRVYGPFLLYRQIEEVSEKASPSEKWHRNSAIPGVQPLFTSKTLKAGTQIVDNGVTQQILPIYTLI
ncbi:hypothetical protein HK100_009790 [Physocladia obscura]|uniref:Uncharacterized protein n=1 Tax=Physocladia obscura TaxID=109957 RepID=A0AAD5T2Z4_9FUNG|nr:hypothetical protein HK100_009790 [Physocladia obscura]